MLAKDFSIIRNYVLSVSLQRKYTFYHQNGLLDAFRTNSRNIIGGNPSMVIPLLANQDLTSMLAKYQVHTVNPRISPLEAYLFLSVLHQGAYSRGSKKFSWYLIIFQLKFFSSKNCFLMLHIQAIRNFLRLLFLS